MAQEIEKKEKNVNDIYTREEIEINKKLYDECKKETLDINAIETLLRRGADPLGTYESSTRFFDEHIYEEIVYDCAVKDSPNLPSITEIFLRNGMDIDNPRVAYDDGNSINPLWSLLFCLSKNGIKTLKMLLDAGISPKSIECFLEHAIVDFLYCYDGELTDEGCLEEFVWLLKMLMLILSYENIVKEIPYLKNWLEYQRNFYNVKEFRDWEKFDYTIDYSKARGCWNCNKDTYDAVPDGSVVKIYEKGTKKLVWSFVFGRDGFPDDV